MRWRPIAAGVLTLIALQVFVSGKGPDAAGSLLGWLAAALRQAMSPEVAALPYRAHAKAAPSPAAPSPAPAPAPGSSPGPIGLPTNPSVNPPVAT